MLKHQKKIFKMIKTVEFKKRTIELISKKKIRIGIIGLGYVGLPLALLFAKKGFKIFGFDNDNKKIYAINKNRSYIERISNKNITLLNKKGNQCFSDYKNISECDIIIICVPTPLTNSFVIAGKFSYVWLLVLISAYPKGV